MVSEDTDSEPIEEMRRRELVEVTIDSLAEVGFVGTTLAQIAARAGVSPGLVAHYFDDKDGLLDAAFRSLARRVGSQVRARLRLVATPRGRIQRSSMPISRRKNSISAPAALGWRFGVKCYTSSA